MIDRKLKHLPELFLVGRVDDTVVATLVMGGAMMARTSAGMESPVHSSPNWNSGCAILVA